MTVTFRAWLVVTWPISTFLIGAWIVFFVSLFSRWEVAASGGAMVAAAILAELFISHNWRYNIVREMDQDFARTGIDTSGIPFNIDADYQCTESDGEFILVDDKRLRFDYLQSLRGSADIRENTWRPSRTVNRLKRYMVWPIAATAIVGTFVWAYGHLFVP